MNVDENESIARRRGNADVLPSASERHNVYRKTSTAVGFNAKLCRPSLIGGSFCAERLQSLVRTLELTGLDEYTSLQKVASFATLVATYEKGETTQVV